MPILILLFVALMGSLGWSVYAEQQQTVELVQFHARCTNQGGTVLRSYKPNGAGWIGCYSGIKELPNEQEK